MKACEGYQGNSQKVAFPVIFLKTKYHLTSQNRDFLWINQNQVFLLNLQEILRYFHKYNYAF